MMDTKATAHASNTDPNRTCTFASININNNSLMQISSFIKNHNTDVLCLQETHRLDLNVIRPWLAKHDLTLSFNAPTVNEADHHFKSGTAILLHTITHSLLQPTVKNIVPNRVQAIKFKSHKDVTLLVNLYMPSGKSFDRRQQRVEILTSLEIFLQSETYDSLVLAGDFNLTLCQIDSTAPLVRSVDFHAFKSFIKRENLVDVFRILNPKTKIFYNRKKCIIPARSNSHLKLYAI